MDLPDGTLQVYFKDGSSVSGTMLIGADGNNSNGRVFTRYLVN